MFLNELDTTELNNVCFTAGSTHILKTCKIGEDKYFLKFSDDELFDSHEPSLQILIEYLAYKIYSLYPGVHIPKNIHLVFDKATNKVGLATQAITGNRASNVPAEVLAKKLSAGVYVDIFLANWDVIGVGAANVISNDESHRIDPGGALTFRAQGGRKGKNFSSNPGELKTMMDPSSGAGAIFQYSDLNTAAETFLKVDFSRIAAQINQVNNEVTSELTKFGMNKLLAQWNDDVQEIVSKLKPRHETITLHTKKMLTESAFKTFGYNLLIEKKNLNEYVDEPEGARFGKVLFGDRRKDDVEKEVDTTEEKEIFWALEDHYNTNSDDRLESSANRIVDLAKQGKYKNILQPPNGFVYRVIRVNTEQATKFFGISIEEMEENTFGYKEMSTVSVKKASDIQSWSFKPKPSVLSDFVDFGYLGQGMITIMMKAKCPEGGKFFMNPYGISNLKLIDKWHNEKEVISYGPIKIIGAAYACGNPFIKIDPEEAIKNMLELCGEK